MSDKPKQKLSSILGNNLFMMRCVARFTPEYFFLMIADGVIFGILHSATSIYNYLLLNAVEDGSDFAYAISIIAVMAVINLLAFVFEKWYQNIKNPIIGYKLQLKMQSELFRKSLSLDLACFDDPEFYNDFVWAMEQSETRACEVMEDTSKLINRIVACCAMLTVLFTIDPIIGIVMLVSSAVSMVCNLIGNKYSFEHQKKGNKLWRRRGYINRVYRLADFAEELRITHADDLLMRDYDENNAEIEKLQKSYGIKYFLCYGLGWTVMGIATYFFLIIYMLFGLTKGTVTVGGLAASVNMVWGLRWQFSDLIARITKYPMHSLFIEKMRQFLSFEPQVVGNDSDIPEFESLEFRNVGFSYEFSSHPKYRFHTEQELKEREKTVVNEALKGVNLKIKKGEKIAIVGYNGAGKTTLIKLIMRLYDPTEGEILYNGINIKNFDPEAYRRKIGVVFQDYKIFATSVAENVMNGEYKDENREKVLSALTAANFDEKLKTMKEGIQTHLTREFNDNGTNLSGGEKQKVVIARVFAGEYPMIIMDEPSSALDPMAEYKLNKSILKTTTDKTVVFISHRLSTTRIADTVYMFDSGRLIESGSHEQLLASGGKYAEMFNLQAEKYRAEC